MHLSYEHRSLVAKFCTNSPAARQIFVEQSTLRLDIASAGCRADFTCVAERALIDAASKLRFVASPRTRSGFKALESTRSFR